MTQNNTSTTRQIRVANASTFYDATYGRHVNLEGLLLPIWYGQNGETRWLDASDREAFIETAVSYEGGSIYTPAWLRAERAPGVSSYGTIEHLAPTTELLFMDWDTAYGQKPSEGSLRYAENHDELLRTIHEWGAHFNLPLHVITETPGGYHLWLLVEPLGLLEFNELTAAMQHTTEEWLASRGLMIDSGVTKTPTRLGRIPGTYHSKPQSDGSGWTKLRSVFARSVSDAPAISVDKLRAAFPAVLPGKTGAALPIVDFGAGDTMDRFNRRVELRDVMTATGWEEVSPRRFNAPPHMRGESDAGQYVDATPERPALFHIFSETTAAALGATTVTAGSLIGHWLERDWRLAFALMERVLEDESGQTLEKILRSLALPEPERKPILERIGYGAGMAWPEHLGLAQRERLQWRGVGADAATKRGYASLQEPVDGIRVPEGSDLLWALKIPYVTVTGEPGFTVQYAIRRSENKPAVGRPRKDGTSPKRSTVVESYHHGSHEAGLCMIPDHFAQIQDVSVPLVIVTETDSDNPTVIRRGVGQVIADAVVTSAARESIACAVVHARDWVSLLHVAGAKGNASHKTRLHSSLDRVPLRERTVFLASRCSWRRDAGLVEMMDLLGERGADVFVLDVPRPRALDTATLTGSLDTSTRSIGDWLAMHSDERPLTKLMREALPADLARARTRVPDDKATTQMAEIVVEEFTRTREFVFVAGSKMWARDVGTAMEIGPTGTSPLFRVSEILEQHDVAVGSVSTLEAVVKAVSQHPDIQVLPTDFDADPYALPVLNGIVDLRTGELRERPCGYLNSKCAPVQYDPDARAPHFEEFLAQVSCGRPDWVAYLKRVVGLSVIGEVVEEVLFFHEGAGRNGKSTFLQVVGDVLGGFTHSIPVEFLADKPNAFQRGDLRGVRFVEAPEPDVGMRMQDSALKQLASRDRINGEKKFGEGFTFAPSHTIHSSVNSVPTIRDRTEGSRRRIVVIPWDLNLSDEEADRGLPARLAGESAGVLKWIVEGAVEVASRIAMSDAGQKLEGGLLNPPASVVERTRQNWDSNDLLKAFIESECVVGEEYAVKSSDFHKAFQAWLLTEGENDWKTATIINQMRMKNFPRRKRGGLFMYVGVTTRASLPAGMASVVNIASAKPYVKPYVSQPVESPAQPAGPGFAATVPGEVEL